MEMYFLEIGLPFFAIGFITWYGTGLDDLLLMSVVFKNKNHRQKIIMFFGNLLAVMSIIGTAFLLSGLRGFLDVDSVWLKLPGIIPILIGGMEIRKLISGIKERNVIKKNLASRSGYKLFAFAYFLYIFNSVDDLVVSATIFLTNNEFVKMIFYSGGFIFGAAASLWLASKFAKVTKKLAFLEFLAPITLIIIGTLIVSGVLHANL